MNTNKLKLTLGLICALVLLPTTSEAATKASLISSNTVLFTIDFSLSDSSFDNEVPVAAKYGVDYLDKVDTVGFTIERDKDTGAEITAVNALVLSTNPLSGVRYAVPKGTETDFTLFILATFAEPVTNDALRARITKLPYYLDGNRTSMHQNQLDELGVPTLVVIGK